MASRKIERLGFDDQIADRLTKIGINNAKDFFELCPLNLMVAADLSYHEVDGLRARAASVLVPQGSYRSALAAASEIDKKNKSKISSGIIGLDAILKGGFLLGTISEVCGAPGIGKTQLCLSACLQCIYSSQLHRKFTEIIQSKVLYIDTELKFDAHRLVEIATAKYPEHFSFSHSSDASENIDKMLSCVVLRRVTSCRELLEEVQNMPQILTEYDIHFVVIDSIAALARNERLTESDSAKFIMKQASLLKRLAENCHCAILVTNQVQLVDYRTENNNNKSSNMSGTNVYYPTTTANPLTKHNNPNIISNTQQSIHDMTTATTTSTTTTTRTVAGSILGDRFMDDKLQGIFVPCLGPHWHHCVTTRIALYYQRCHNNNNNNNNKLSGQRSEEDNRLNFHQQLLPVLQSRVGNERMEEEEEEEEEDIGLNRICHLLKSPIAKRARCTFTITEKGIT